MGTKDKIAQLIAEGIFQQSRKYRRVAKLPAGETGLQALQRANPTLHARVLRRAEETAREYYLHYEAAKEGNVLELTHEEFNQFLTQTGRKPNASPPDNSGCEECGSWTNNHSRTCSKSTK